MASRLLAQAPALQMRPPRAAVLAASKGIPVSPRDPAVPALATKRPRTLAAIRGPQPPTHPPAKVLRDLRLLEGQAFGTSRPRMYPGQEPELPIPELGEGAPEVIDVSDEEIKEEQDLAPPVEPAPAGFLEPSLRDLPEDPRGCKDIAGVYDGFPAWRAAIVAWDRQLASLLSCMKDQEPGEPAPAMRPGPRTPPQGPVKKSESPLPRQRSEPWSWQTPSVDPEATPRAAASPPDDNWGSWSAAGKVAKEVPAGMHTALLEHVHGARSSSDAWEPATRTESWGSWGQSKDWCSTSTQSWGSWGDRGGTSDQAGSGSWGKQAKKTAGTEVKGKGKQEKKKKTKGHAELGRPAFFNHTF